jgi:4-oxalocrotonate tautomerase
MPLIQVKMIEKVFTPAEKQEVITRLTDALVSVEGESLRPYTLVIIEEVGSGEWAVGGKALTTEAVHALREVKPGGGKEKNR